MPLWFNIKKGKDNLVVVALSRKVETEDDLASDVLSSKAKSVNLTFEDDLDSQEGVLCTLSFPSPAWLTNLKQACHGSVGAGCFTSFEFREECS